MKGISHRQAIRWIDRRLDGLLNEKQLLLLSEHLASCESCRAYAAEMNVLADRLQHEFHSRWDEQQGPSQKVFEHVTAKASRIPTMNRLASTTRLFAGAAALIALAVAINFVVSQVKSTAPAAASTETTAATETMDPSALVESPLLALASEQTGDLEIYTMRADGSEVTNITNHPANDYSPVWSPDGKQIAFVSNRDSNEDIYVMNADGSSLTRLTEDATAEMIPVWSPDGTKIAYASRNSDTSAANLYVSDPTGQNRRRLTNDVPEMVWPETWSPDSQYLFFLINGRIFKTNVESSETTAVTPDKDAFSQFVLSPDGSRLLYLGWCGQNSAEFCSTVKSVNVDGTGEETHSTVQFQQACPSATNGSGHYELIKWSPDRTKIVFAFYCEQGSGWFYIANADGSDFKPLTRDPILHEASGFEWAPDSQSIIFSSALEPSQRDRIYTLNIQDALQNPDIRPTPLNASVAQIASFAWQPVNESKVGESPLLLKIDPQSCKPASTLNSALQPPNELYGYDLVQGTSLTNGDFSYEFWLYCDPSLQPDDQQNLNTVAGLGIFTSWRYTGPEAQGPVEYYYAFKANHPLGTSGTSGPLNKASAIGAKFGIDVSKTTILSSIQEGTPIQFRVVVNSGLGQNSAVLLFRLEPTQQGLRVIDLHAEDEKPMPEATP